MKNIKRRKYNTIRRKNQKAQWRLILAAFLFGVTSIIFPFALDVLEPSNSIIPTVRVHRNEVQAEQLDETDRQKIERVAKEKCAEKGLGDFCWKDLLGIAYTETRAFNCKAVGDGGASHGCFQIHRGYHQHITVEQAQSIDFSVNWTLNRLIANGYPEYRSVSIMKHNGTPHTTRTKAYLETVNSYVDSL